MCGPSSALGLDEVERAVWPDLRERLRRPGRLMALMRGVLGGDAEVAAVVSITPEGVVTPLALLATPGIVAEITLREPAPADGAEGRDRADVRRGRIGDYDVDVLMRTDADAETPAAVLVSPWIFEHLTLYARKLWSRR